MSVARPELKAAHQVIDGALAARVFPAAAVDVGGSDGALWQESWVTPLDTPFDLASLTKPIATTTIIMRLVENGSVALDDPVSRAFADWRGADRLDVAMRDLLEHASGLAARLVDAPPEGRREFEHEICGMPLEYRPRTQSIYSDLGFILLGFLAADRGRQPIDAQFRSAVGPVAPGLEFSPGADVRRRAAPTTAMSNDHRRGRVLTGEVHDNYAALLGGVAGHAGLFGSAEAVGEFARAVLRAARGDQTIGAPLTPELVRLFTTPSTVPGSSRALGWDTMRVASSCGTRMTPAAFGHVGFTGTSLWIDPQRDRYFVLLTNRAHGGGSLDAMRDVRRAFHDALAEV